MVSETSTVADLDALGERVSQIVALVKKLRAENEGLREQLAQAEAGDHDDAARGQEVRRRLVALLKRLEEF